MELFSFRPCTFNFVTSRNTMSAQAFRKIIWFNQSGKSLWALGTGRNFPTAPNNQSEHEPVIKFIPRITVPVFIWPFSTNVVNLGEFYKNIKLCNFGSQCWAGIRINLFNVKFPLIDRHPHKQRTDELRGGFHYEEIMNWTLLTLWSCRRSSWTSSR